MCQREKDEGIEWGLRRLRAIGSILSTNCRLTEPEAGVAIKAYALKRRGNAQCGNRMNGDMREIV